MVTDWRRHEIQHNLIYVLKVKEFLGFIDGLDMISSIDNIQERLLGFGLSSQRNDVPITEIGKTTGKESFGENQETTC
jgi:hypothetical protein